MSRRKLKTNAERQAELRDGRRLAGHKQITVWIDCQSLALLQAYIRETGATQEEAVNHALKEGLGY